MAELEGLESISSVAVQTAAISRNCFHPHQRKIDMKKTLLLATLLAAAALVACGKKEAPAAAPAAPAEVASAPAADASAPAAPASEAASK